MARGSRVVVLALACALVAEIAAAQGKSQDPHGNGKGRSTPPSRSVLPPPSTGGGFGGGGSPSAPFALVDDATVLPEGSVWTAVSASRWDGSGISEVDAPIVTFGVGLTRRVQLTASVPRVVGSADPTGAAGGLGTTFLTGKVDVSRHGWPVKVAVAPTIEILGSGAIAQTPATTGRLRWGVPASVEIDRGRASVYGGGGYFSGGVWFAGGGAGAPISRRVAVSVSLTHATATSPTGDPLDAIDRTDLTGGAAFILTSRIALFGSAGHTIATLDQNGAGMIVGGGVSLLFTPAR